MVLSPGYDGCRGMGAPMLRSALNSDSEILRKRVSRHTNAVLPVQDAPEHTLPLNSPASGEAQANKEVIAPWDL